MHTPVMGWRSCSGIGRAVSGFRHGKRLSFQKGLFFAQWLLYLTQLFEIRRERIRIVSVVVVRVAVGVDITEVVRVVVIR